VKILNIQTLKCGHLGVTINLAGADFMPYAGDPEGKAIVLWTSATAVSEREVGTEAIRILRDMAERIELMLQVTGPGGLRG
jgi:hypothetical protein